MIGSCSHNGLEEAASTAATKKSVSPHVLFSRRRLQGHLQRLTCSIDRSDSLAPVGCKGWRVKCEIPLVSLAPDDQEREPWTRLSVTIRVIPHSTCQAIVSHHAAVNLTSRPHSTLLVRQIRHANDIDVLS
jgi:hypothetical protein